MVVHDADVVAVRRIDEGRVPIPLIGSAFGGIPEGLLEGVLRDHNIIHLPESRQCAPCQYLPGNGISAKPLV
jgi:hypothetical protein